MTMVMVDIRVGAHSPRPPVTPRLVTRLEQTLVDTSRAGACSRVRSDSVVVAVAGCHHGDRFVAHTRRQLQVDRAVRLASNVLVGAPSFSAAACRLRWNLQVQLQLQVAPLAAHSRGSCSCGSCRNPARTYRRASSWLSPTS